MLKSPRAETESSDDDLDQRLRQSFARMRSKIATQATPAAPAVIGHDQVEPSLPAKLFIGPNSTWYDDCWRWMEWRGRTTSWNGAAAASLGVWFGYRRMYAWCALAMGWLCLLAVLALLGVPLRVLLTVETLAMIAAGLYGNHLYLRHFRRIAHEVAGTRHTHAAQVQAITAAGGVEPRTAGLAAAASAAVVLLVAVVMALLGVGPDLRF